MSENTQQTEQPTDLLGYIAGQPVADGGQVEGVTRSESDATANQGTAESIQNAPEAASQQVSPVLTPPVPNQPDEASIRLQQENEQLRRTLLALGQESGKREQSLFEKSIEHLDEDEQALARERRRVEGIEAQNTFLRNSMEAQRASYEATQEQISKGQFAQEVHRRLGLPNDPTVFALLMESSSPAELVVRGQSLARFYTATTAQQQQATAQAAQRTGVHNADGSSGPAQPAGKTPERKGDLIGMMREIPYEYAPAT